MKLAAPSELYRTEEMAQLANNLLREHDEDLSSGTRIHNKKARETVVVVGGWCWQQQHWHVFLILEAEIGRSLGLIG